MIKAKYLTISYILLSFLLLSCDKTPLEVKLQKEVLNVLDLFSKDQQSYIDTLNYYNEPFFYEISYEQSDKNYIFHLYLIEYNLNEYVRDFVAHSKYKNKDVVIYGELNPALYIIDKSNKSEYLHIYSNYEGYYDPPFWKLYFNSEGKLIDAYPKEVYKNINW